MAMSQECIVPIFLAALTWPALAQPPQPSRALAERLANDATREFVIAQLAQDPSVIPVLLELTQDPPVDVDVHELHIGLIEAFGRLKVSAAIPFLIRNIGLRRDRFIDLAPWLKKRRQIDETFPAISALISIGPLAATAIIRERAGLKNQDDRLAAICVVSSIDGVATAPEFLREAQQWGRLEAYWAMEGLRNLAR